MRKIVCILMSAIMIFSLCVTSYAVEVTIEDQPLIVNDEKTLLVNAYCGAINERNYPAIVNMSPISIRQLMSSIYSNELNEENKVGLFNINSIVADSIQWGMATALQDYLPAETIDAYPDYDVALVKASIDYEVEDIGIHDGVNYLCVIVVEDADGKYIADVLHIDKSYAEQISSDAAASLGIDTPISANILLNLKRSRSIVQINTRAKMLTFLEQLKQFLLTNTAIFVWNQNLISMSLKLHQEKRSRLL